MAAPAASSLGAAVQATEQRHKPRAYHPSPWGDFFLGHQPCTPAELLSMKEEARTKEEVVRRAVLAASASASAGLAAKLELVDALQRIGVAYRFGEEINGLLRALVVHDDADEDEDEDDGGDLYLTSLRFYLLRKHGFNVTSRKNVTKCIRKKKNVTKCILVLLIVKTLLRMLLDVRPINDLYKMIRCVCQV
jgi:hypothetical protein